MASVGWFSTAIAQRGLRTLLHAYYIARGFSNSAPSYLTPCVNNYKRRLYSKMHNLDRGHSRTRVAVLYQALDPPVIGGVQKPKKPGGYQDSGADIAYNLSGCAGIDVISPSPSAPDPAQDSGWCFPDVEEGILEAVNKGATHLWANTILFASHPLQTSTALEDHLKCIQVVGQGPLVVEKYDDKRFVNDFLRQLGGFTMPRAWDICSKSDMEAIISRLPYPIVAKPIRGRGSQGVKVCYSSDELAAHAQILLTDSSSLMLEEFLQGEEITITVMPPTKTGGVPSAKPEATYWPLPVVTRFNHQEGIAPYNGVVAVANNSKPVPKSDLDPTYTAAMEECTRAAQALGVTAPIRIDARRFKDTKDSKFALFDVNMKPNMTGPGRPGRDDQASLTLIAASALGWDYPELLRRILETSRSLKDLRALEARGIGSS